MSDKPIKIPGPDHPITTERNQARVVVTLGGRVIADTRDALALREATYPAVQYIPREDVDMSLLQRTDHASHCPYKGDASYYQHPDRWRAVEKCRLDLRKPACGGGRNQGPPGLRSRSGG